MGTLILAVTTLSLYSLGIVIQTLAFRGRIQSVSRLNTPIGVLALIGHGALIWNTLIEPSTLNLGFFHAAVLISWLVVLLALVVNAFKALQAFFLAVYPLAVLTIISLLAFHAPAQPIRQESWGMLSHVALSVTAYSLFTLAAVQALLLYLQDHQLKRNYNGRLVRNLPPLMTMESLLFELLWAGMAMLTLAIITGAIFVEDLLAQHLAHKTVFTLLSWCVFAALLTGHYVQGWRGLTASRWTLSGCLLLSIAYFGSKFVLELIFQGSA